MPKKITEKKEAKKLTQEEFEKKVISLAEKGLTSEKIGEALKKEKIHSKEFSKKITQILGNKAVNADLKNLSDKLERIKKHVEKNKGDKRSIREKEKVSARLRRLRNYLNK